jgi:hypothetical protein
MKKIKLFMNVKAEQNWLASQKGWKLVSTNGISYIFEKCSHDYNYEYVFFNKNKKELDNIIKQIEDSDIEFVCNSSSWALFRKRADKGEIHVYADNNLKYQILRKKYQSYTGLGACYMCLGSSQIALTTTVNSIFGLTSALFYLCSLIFFLYAYYISKYSLEYK